MHDTHLPLRKWFLAIYLMCESKKGMSARQLGRTLGVAFDRFATSSTRSITRSERTVKVEGIGR